MKVLNLSLIIFLVSIPFAYSQLTLVKDINTGNEQSFAYRISVVCNGNAYFVANDGVSGHEVWKSDGTTSGTNLCKNIFPGNETCNPQAFGTDNKLVYFLANDSLHGNELWKTDGTVSGTQLVIDSKPGVANSKIYVPFNEYETFAFINEKNYFLQNDGLYETDGSSNGTKLLYSIPVSYDLEKHNNLIYFVGRVSFYDSIYVFNSTTNKIQAIKYNFRSPGSLVSTPIGLLVSDNDKLYNINSTLNTVTDITPVESISSYSLKNAASFHKGFYYFVATNRNDKLKPYLFRTNGLTGGTQVYANISLDNFSSYGYFKSEGDYLFFFYNSASSMPTELWRTDGTVSGLVKLDSYNSSSLNSISPAKNVVGHLRKIYYFGQKDDEISLYESDGTQVGTKPIALIDDGFASRQLTTGLMKLKNLLLFSAAVKSNKSIGEELWSFALPIDTKNNDLNEQIISFSPNPVHDKVKIEINSDIRCNYSIMNLCGVELVKDTELNNSRIISFEKFVPGIYFISLNLNGTLKCIKIIKE